MNCIIAHRTKSETKLKLRSMHGAQAVMNAKSKTRFQTGGVGFENGPPK